MNNLSSYCGLADSRISASDKDLPVLEFKSRPGFDEGIFESYVHLNTVVPALAY